MAVIGFLYRGSLPDGTVFDDSEGVPHEIVTGRSQIMPVLEQNLLEMAVGEERTVQLAAEDAYGPYVEKNVERVPVFMIPQGEDLQEGALIHWTSPNNSKPLVVRIRSIANQVAELDFNHPLAGKDLSYWVKLVGRED
ncbi:MAG: FKBP-type peptidyl-prolyl cis-trans isomerase [Coriobacteriales bacterium]|jgi:peptidylprolyl isomerase|nr:FKBP-type peptidyl-prolyl cis-trans isomerase [Coriobacteriales bacterium]